VIKHKKLLALEAFNAGWDGAIEWTRAKYPDNQGDMIYVRAWANLLDKRKKMKRSRRASSSDYYNEAPIKMKKLKKTKTAKKVTSKAKGAGSAAVLFAKKVGNKKGAY